MSNRLVLAAFTAVAAAASLSPASRAYADGYTPPPAESVSGYSATPYACTITRVDRTRVVCKDGFLEKKSLRELSILRNTIYARYGWDGFRKPWLNAYFHAQPWFKPNPKFSYKLLSPADQENGHYIATREQSLSQTELEAMKATADFFAGLHDPSKYKSAETIELADFDGRKCYKVRLVSTTGTESFEYFDVATGLRAGAVQTVESQMGKLEQTAVPSEYKEFGGIKFPTRILSKNGQFEFAITMTSVEFDKVDAATFALPDAIKALVKP